MQIANVSALSSAAQSTASAASLVAQDTNYSAIVGGKTYDAEVNRSAGVYVASVPQLAPPVSVTGSSLLIAESNLSARINLLV